MDFFTHALLPYLLASYLAWEKRWVAALVLGGIAPDLDVFLSWAGSILPTHLLLVHRGITHSIFFGLLFGLLVLYLAALPRVRGLWRRDDLDLEFSARSLVLVWAGVALHLLLDYATTRGVPLFYPWQSLRYSADLFFQIELAVLAATILILAAMLRSWPTNRQKENLFVVFLLFLLLVGGIRMEGRWAAEEDFALGNASIYPLPGLFSWAALEEKGNSYLVSRYDLIAGTASFSPAIPRLKLALSQKEAEEALAAAEDPISFSDRRRAVIVAGRFAFAALVVSLVANLVGNVTLARMLTATASPSTSPASCRPLQPIVPSSASSRRRPRGGLPAASIRERPSTSHAPAHT